MTRTSDRSNRTPWALGVTLLCAILWLLFWSIASRIQNRFVLENQTTQTIMEARIDVCKHSYILRNIRPGGRAWRTFILKRGDSYDVRLTLQDGSEIKAVNQGYVCGPYGLRDRIIVAANRKVQLVESRSWP